MSRSRCSIAGSPTPARRGWRDADSVAFVTVGEQGQPTARTVSLKRLEGDALVFTSALWTRKAREIERNPHVALLFHWATLGRQVHVAGHAALAERALAEELFAERDPSHQLQTIVSRQGEPIDGPRAVARASSAPARRDGGAARLPARLGRDPRQPPCRRVLVAGARSPARSAAV